MLSSQEKFLLLSWTAVCENAGTKQNAGEVVATVVLLEPE